MTVQTITWDGDDFEVATHTTELEAGESVIRL